MTVGERIKSVRQDRGMTQAELAKKSHTTKQTIYKYEMGIITNIPSNRIEQVANALGCSPAVLMGWADENAVDGSCNSGVIGVVGNSNSGAVTIGDKPNHTLTTQEQDMLRIYNAVEGKTQLEIMSCMYDIEKRELQS